MRSAMHTIPGNGNENLEWIHCAATNLAPSDIPTEGSHMRYRPGAGQLPLRLGNDIHREFGGSGMP